MTSLRSAFALGGKAPVSQGDVCWVASDHLRMTGGDPPAKTRPVIIVGEASLLQDPLFPFAWVVPCTTSPRSSAGPLEVPIPAGEAGLAPGTHAIAYLLQPFRKDQLPYPRGAVSQTSLESILAAVAFILDI